MPSATRILAGLPRHRFRSGLLAALTVHVHLGQMLAACVISPRGFDTGYGSPRADHEVPPIRQRPRPVVRKSGEGLADRDQQWDLPLTYGPLRCSPSLVRGGAGERGPGIGRLVPSHASPAGVARPLQARDDLGSRRGTAMSGELLVVTSEQVGGALV